MERRKEKKGRMKGRKKSLAQESLVILVRNKSSKESPIF